MKERKDLGNRRHERIDFHRPGFVILAPDTPWMDCFIIDISASGLCLHVGTLDIPDIFGVSFTPCGTVRRVCSMVWRRDALIGGKFLSARELRQPAVDKTGRALHHEHA